MTLGQHCRNNSQLHQRVARAVELGSIYHMGTTTGSSDAYVLSPELTIDDYKDGERYSAFANHTNTTTTPTLNISSRGATTIVADDAGTAVAAGDIQDGKLFTVLYNETRDELILINRDFEAEIDAIERLPSSPANLDYAQYNSSSGNWEAESFRGLVYASRQTNNQNINTSTWTTLLLSTQLFSLGGIVTNTSGEFEFTKSGIYIAHVQIAFALESTGERFGRIGSSTSTNDGAYAGSTALSNGQTMLNLVSRPFASSLSLYVQAWHNRGSALNVLGGTAPTTHISIYRVGDE